MSSSETIKRPAEASPLSPPPPKKRFHAVGGLKKFLQESIDQDIQDYNKNDAVGCEAPDTAQTTKISTTSLPVGRSTARPEFAATPPSRKPKGPIVVHVDEVLGLLEKSRLPLTTTATKPLTAKDEGYYEGSVAVALPDDTLHLNPLLSWIRQQVNFFSVTTQDRFMSRSTRQFQSVGTVGLLCRHCATAQRLDRLGAVVFPPSLQSAAHALVHGRFLQHFQQSCGSLIPTNQTQLRILTMTDEWPRPVTATLSATTYSVMAARQLGVTELWEGDTPAGLRFSRDVNLRPLSLGAVLARHAIADNEVPHPTLERIATDPESERVLAQEIYKGDGVDNPQQSPRVVEVSDKSYLTDFIFLALRQLQYCYATAEDVSTSKHKGLRVGQTGFECCYCSPTPTSYRYFAGAGDNLPAFANSLLPSHLIQKCPHVPQELRRALQAYRKIHTRQMNQLPADSQRRLFHDLRQRLRSRDLSPAEKDFTAFLAEEAAPLIQASLPAETTSVSLETIKGQYTFEEEIDASAWERPANLPVSDDPDVVRVLQESRHNNDWDERENGGLILHSESNLVSDYVFLTMRQLKVAVPAPGEQKKGFGLQCRHCNGRKGIKPSGRTFPSAPDNFASALNTFMYNHHQACPEVPAEIKHTLRVIRAMHSNQCSSLRYGAQRLYFNRVFRRLAQMHKDAHRTESLPVRTATRESPQEQASDGEPEVNMNDLDYLIVRDSKGRVQVRSCRRCQALPIGFRSIGSVSYGDDTVARRHAAQHASSCTGEGGYFDTACSMFQEALTSSGIPLAYTFTGSFLKVLERLLGPRIGDAFMARLRSQQRHDSEAESISLRDWRLVPHSVDEHEMRLVFANWMRSVLGDGSSSSTTDLKSYPAVLDWMAFVNPAAGFMLNSVSSG